MKKLLKVFVIVLLLSGCSTIEEAYLLKEGCFIEFDGGETLYFDRIRVSTNGYILADGKKITKYKRYYCPVYILKDDI